MLVLLYCRCPWPKVEVISHKIESKILKGIAMDGVGVALTCFRDYVFMMKSSPEAKRMTNVHFSRESGRQSDYGGWTLPKISPWKDAINRHILILDQVWSSD